MLKLATGSPSITQSIFFNPTHRVKRHLIWSLMLWMVLNQVQ